MSKNRPQTRGRGTAFRTLLGVALVITAGCSSSPRSPETVAPEPETPAATWQMVEQDILQATATAKTDASAYAHQEMDQWMAGVRRLTEEEFIPWYTSYLTQEWLAVKVAFYKSNDADDEAAAVNRLARYLQEQYVDRVLEPASEETDPSRILRRSTQLFVDTLTREIDPIGPRYQIPDNRLREHLYQIPAVSAEDELAPGVSVGRLISTDDLSELRPYATLMEQIESAGVDINSRLTEGELSPIASAVAETFVRKIAVRGGAAAAAAVVGGPIGMAVSLGIAGYSVGEHSKQEPELKAQTRDVIGPAVEQMQRNLMDDPRNGVLGGITHINGQIEQRLGVLQPAYELRPYEEPSFDDDPGEPTFYDDAVYEKLW